MPAQPSTMASARSSRIAARDLRGDLAEGVGVALLEREHRDLGGADAGAALGEAVFPQIMLDRHDGDTERRHHGKARRDQARHVEAGFADADHRRFRRGARGVEAGVVEAGDDMARPRRRGRPSRMQPSMPGTAKASS